MYGSAPSGGLPFGSPLTLPTLLAEFDSGKPLHRIFRKAIKTIPNMHLDCTSLQTIKAVIEKRHGEYEKKVTKIWWRIKCFFDFTLRRSKAKNDEKQQYELLLLELNNILYHRYRCEFNFQLAETKKNLTLENLERFIPHLDAINRQISQIKDLEQQNTYRKTLSQDLAELTNLKSWPPHSIESAKWKFRPGVIPILIKHLKAFVSVEEAFAAKLSFFVEARFNNKTFFEALQSAGQITEGECVTLSLCWKQMLESVKGMNMYMAIWNNDIEALESHIEQMGCDDIAESRMKHLITNFMSAFDPHYQPQHEGHPLSNEHFSVYMGLLGYFMKSIEDFTLILQNVINRDEANPLFAEFKRLKFAHGTSGQSTTDPLNCAMAPVQRFPQHVMWLQEVSKFCEEVPDGLAFYQYFIQLKLHQSNLAIGCG
jgi:hypothetical protein